MARTTVAPPTADQLYDLERRKGLTPVQIALSKARAARFLLLAVADDGFQWGDVETTPPEKLEHHIDWIRSFAADALQAALDEAEAAFLKATA